MLEELVSPDAAKRPAPQEENTTFFNPLRKRRNQVPKIEDLFLLSASQKRSAVSKWPDFNDLSSSGLFSSKLG
jgi:hypothetical protein